MISIFCVHRAHTRARTVLKGESTQSGTLDFHICFFGWNTHIRLGYLDGREAFSTLTQNSETFHCIGKIYISQEIHGTFTQVLSSVALGDSR